MTSVLFVCLGNICRSPMAEAVLRSMAEAHGLAGRLCIASAGTSDEESGHDIYPPARRILLAHNVPCPARQATALCRADYLRYDAVLCMESSNVSAALRIFGGDPAHKVHRLLDETSHPRDIADPWYSGNFTLTYDEICEGCEAWLVRHF